MSNFWHLDQLKAQVETLLLDVLDQTTCCLFYEAAIECRCSEQFREAVMRYIRSHFAALLPSNASEANIVELVQTRLAVADEEEDTTIRTMHDPIEKGWLPRADVDDCKEVILLFYKKTKQKTKNKKTKKG